MVANAVLHRLTPNVALLLAGGAGLCVALAGLALPGELLERLVVTSGVAAFVPAAEPPLGMTARACVGLFAGGLAAMLAWFALSIVIALVDAKATQGTEAGGERRPTVRRADAHPDARPREPLRASDLAVPVRGAVPELPQADPVEADAPLAMPPGELWAQLPDEPVIAMGAPSEARPVHAAPPPVQDLPADLDQPLAAFDPAAIPPVPMAPPPPVRPLRRPAPPPIFDPGERFEAFELAPVRAPVAPAAADAAPVVDASVQALLERLERSMAKRGVVEVAPPEPEPVAAPVAVSEPPRSLADTLSELRRLATRP